MTVIFGPLKSHSSYIEYVDWINLPAGTCVCGGRFLYTNGLGTAFIVAPASTEVSDSWNGSTDTVVGNKPSVNDWLSLCTALTNAGLTPSQWFVPNMAQLECGCTYQEYWECPTPDRYWSSNEFTATHACFLNIYNGRTSTCTKTTINVVRAFRCVTY